MKCPKCAYLGFETGDRCKNCGYDFSLIGTSTFVDDAASAPAAVASDAAPGHLGFLNIPREAPFAQSDPLADLSYRTPTRPMVATVSPATATKTPDLSTLPLFLANAL